MDPNPYEPPREVNDLPVQPTHPEFRQIIYSLTAAVVSGLFLLLYAVPTLANQQEMPQFAVVLFCLACGGIVVGPVFCLLSLLRWLTSK